MPMSDEQHWVERLREGDQAALRAIYERYKDDLLTVAACLLGDVATAEDALHDVFVAFAAMASRLRVRSSLKGYLVACIANRSRDRLRRKAAEPTPLAEADDVVAPAIGPAETIINGEESEQLHQALATLPYEQREAITLHLHGDMTFKEIARHQGVSINTAQSRYRYGLDKLRSILEVGART
jgi:RNA polymerase sigma factor (sigma-70 family)